ncbi:hypothetical protein Rs2_48303 [Raphanus sativus]|uniref:Protein OXIDATIVE STRESS 3-like n=1 Tax=Raphanus sativus TaxID=3726 RepID=A0A6J0MJB5_RAPSA|nr:protein OXIDATIVE STRESS 3-like [Raphanus sativus]KAJ4870103.1 hypothetical protein Rs2_48303 [Raphanus sativus]
MSVHAGSLIWTTNEEDVERVSRSSAKDSSDSTEEEASSSFSSNGAFDDLSDLISQLPTINEKKGLSKHYKGKSQSFTSLANVTCLTDLVKKRPRMKTCRSSGSKGLYRPNATISMKATRTSSSSTHSNSRLINLKTFL